MQLKSRPASAYRLKSGPFAVIEHTICRRRKGRSLRPARRPPSSFAPLLPEYRLNGRASIYPFLYMLRLSVVCSITSLPLPLIILTLVESIPFYRHTKSLTFTWGSHTYSSLHAELHDPSVSILIHRDLNTRVSSLLFMLIITHKSGNIPVLAY